MTNDKNTGRELTTDEDLKRVIDTAQRVAVLGIKTSAQAKQAAYYVPEYLSAVGIEVVPVPVYYPEVTEILGKKVYRAVRDVQPAVDIVDVFRKPEDITAHLEDLIAAHPKTVWFQQGIRNDTAAAKLISAGIDVVQDRCLMEEHRRLA